MVTTYPENNVQLRSLGDDLGVSYYREDTEITIRLRCHARDLGSTQAKCVIGDTGRNPNKEDGERYLPLWREALAELERLSRGEVAIDVLHKCAWIDGFFGSGHMGARIGRITDDVRDEQGRWIASRS